jgi:ATP-dependent helicase/nuclease subunit B
VPTNAEVQQGFSPQLTLEAAIALAGGFDGLKVGRVDGLIYVSLTGAGDGGEDSEIGFGEMTLDQGVDEALARFKAFVAMFDAPDMPYLSKPHVLLMNRPGDYDHLARVKEWSSGGSE